MSDDYWTSCIEESFEDAGIKASKAQIETVVAWVEGCHDNYGMAHGHHAIPNPETERANQAERLLEIELRKVFCRECNGTGWITTHGPYHSGSSQCSTCMGEGRRSP